MSYDREEFEGLAARKRDERSASQLPMLRALAAVKPKMEALTGDERWDHYLAHLSGIIEQLREAKEAARNRLADPNMVNADWMMQAKIALAINEAQIAAFEIARDLPKALIESAEAARKVIERWEGSRGKSA